MHRLSQSAPTAFLLALALTAAFAAPAMAQEKVKIGFITDMSSLCRCGRQERCRCHTDGD
jgi:branched-chain amino acid transport system substrate-binding protein